MSKRIFFLLFALITLKSQAQLVINGAAAININGGTSSTPAYLVLNTSSAAVTPIKTTGTTGGIIMESEYNITKYLLGTLTNTISVPYFSNNTGSWVQFPLGVTGISGASGSGNLQFSSKHATTFSTGWDNTGYLPSDVTNMNGWMPTSTYTTNNSMDAIDRFWIIDAVGYVTSPGVTYDFGYITAEGNANGGNVFTVSNLQAEGFDRSAGNNIWGNIGPVGVNTTGATTGDVGSVIVAAGQIGTKYRSWTLVDKLNPLPVKLLYFKDECLANGNIILSWATAYEINSASFIIEKSTDGINYNMLGVVAAAGNSQQEKKYSFTDDAPSATAYYRLLEKDVNGSAVPVSNMIGSTACSGVKESASIYNNHVKGGAHISFNSAENQQVNLTVYDITGRLVYQNLLEAQKGNNDYDLNPATAQGIYVFNLQTNSNTIIKRVVLEK